MSKKEDLLKFADERDLLKANPQMKELKDEITNSIHETFEQMNYIEKYEENIEQINKRIEQMIKPLVDQRYIMQDIITKCSKKITRNKEMLAKAAYALQQNGIFWTDNIFIVKKPSENRDWDATYNQLSEEDKKQYQKVVMDLVKIKTIKDNIVYSYGQPQLARYPKEKIKQ